MVSVRSQSDYSALHGETTAALSFPDNGALRALYVLMFSCFQVCAIVGGTFTVAGIVDSCLFSATEMYKKWEMGKLN